MIQIKPKFDLGSIVVCIAQRLACERASIEVVKWKKPDPNLLVILEIMSVTCPGGTQIHYACRHASSEGIGLDPIRFNEIELELYVPPSASEEKKQ